MKHAKWHVLFWFCYFLLALTNDLITDPGATFTKEVIFFLSQNIYLFYSLLYFLRTFSSRSRKELIISISRLILIIGIFVGMRYWIRYYFLATYFDEAYRQLPLRAWASTCVLWIINYFIYAAAYFYFRTSLQKQKDLLHSKEVQLTQEREKAQFENIALRAQINPHFLYNTLDLFYAKALPLDTELSDGIMNLADIMRYSIRKPGQDDGMVCLTEEIEHIKNVIQLNRLRFNHSFFVSFTCSGPVEGVKIIPLVLITLVENVLKHGLLNDPAHPALINLVVDEQAQQLVMTTHNKKRTGPKELSTGIGLDNTVKRLQTVYGNTYELNIHEEQDIYETTLGIKIANPIPRDI